jgi:hypothetical protein
MVHRVVPDLMACGQNFPDEIGIFSDTPSDAKKCGMHSLPCKLIQYAQRRSWIWAIIDGQIDTLDIIKSRDHLAAQCHQITKLLPNNRPAYRSDRACEEVEETQN